MMNTSFRLFHLPLLLAGLAGVSACNHDSDKRPDDTANRGTETVMEPAFETEQSVLDAALECSPFEHPDKPPVLLVHGTFTNGWEQYEWSYKPVLEEMGFDVCIVSYQDRGLGDLQISAEFVVNALRRMHAESGRKVAMIGHSQGALMPRWALKWWPSARDAVEDFVLHAGPNHGTDQAASNPVSDTLVATGGMPEAFFQMATDSEFETVLNADDETPGEIDYTSIYTEYDELVQPVSPVPTAALDWELDNPRVSNILLQDICPGLLVDHVTIGISDTTTFLLTLDAILNPGPADVERAGGSSLCAAVPILPGVTLPPDFALRMVMLFPREMEQGMSDPHTSSEEPPLKPYAQTAQQP